MIISTAHAPELRDLRPARDTARTPTFPVYPDIDAVLDAPDPAPAATLESYPRGHVLAVASAYAYSDAQTVATIVARLGLERNRCVQVAEEVDALLITSSASLVQSTDGATVVLAYRGTRPTGFIDVLGDIDTSAERLRVETGPLADQDVHAGFYRNARATRAEVLRRLEAARYGHPIDTEPERDAEGVPVERGPLAPLTALHVTGHSLGGAQAAFFGLLLCAEAATDGRRRALAETLRTVHTFGQPMLGSPDFARAADGLAWPAAAGERFGDHLLRWIHRDDIVPTTPIRASGPFAHTGRERRFRPDVGWGPEGARTAQLDNLVAVLLTPASFLAQTFALTRDRWIGPSIDDHLPERYLDALRPPGVTSEFGD